MDDIKTYEAIEILPLSIKKIIQNMKFLEELQEIRIKINKPVIFQIGNKEFISDYSATLDDLKNIIQRISNYSIYAFEEDIRQGYITIKGGHRVGICGKCVLEKGKIKTIKDFSSINIRISKQVLGCSNFLIPYIVKRENILNTIIISPPKCGKTTIIRDLSRVLSNGIPNTTLGKKVCIIDERSEIASCFNGVPQLDVGIRTDVLDCCPKSEGIMMALRSMSPELIVCDEIGTDKDVESIITAMNSGVSVITTIHGYQIEDVLNREVFRNIIKNKIFNKAVVLSARRGVGTLEYIYDFNRQEKYMGGCNC